MAVSPSDLINNVVNSFQNFFTPNGDFSQGNYPKDAAISRVLNVIQRSNWNKLPNSYTFAVIKNETDTSLISEFTEFPLPLNPSEITQDENFAINIRPTQGGTSVNHSGNKYKELIISGTTGIAPFRGAGGVNSSTGEAIFQPRELRYASGYEVFQRLRNYFKAYHEYKNTSSSTEAQQAKLIFKNYKDGEFLIIEVPKFTMKRNASRPFIYDYTISARVIGFVQFKNENTAGVLGTTFDKAIENIQDAVNKIDIARGVFLRQRDILSQVEATYDQVVLEPLRKVGLALKAVIGASLALSDVAPSIIRRSLSTRDTIEILLTIDSTQRKNKNTGNLDSRLKDVQIPVNIEKTVSETGPDILLRLPGDASQAIQFSILPIKAQTAVIAEQTEILENPRSFYENLKVQIERVQDNANDAFNFNDSLYDNLFNRTPTLISESTKRATDAEIEVLYGLEQAVTALNQIISTNILFKSSYADRIANVNSKFDTSLGLRADSAVKEIIFPTGMTLERLALQQLGDTNRWGEIVELNNLKPPYIGDTNSLLINVVKPGDRILIPQPVRFGFGNSINIKETYLNSDLTELEKNLGIDLKLSKENDLILTNKNDLDIIRGANNAAQSILFKLAIEKGEILDHPSLGIGLKIGDKIPTLVEVQTDLTNTLLQDSRFENIQKLEIDQTNGTFRVKFLIKLKNIDVPVPVDLRF